MTLSTSNEAATRLAYFVSPHGFGHAARAGAVLAELQRLHPALAIDIFTLVPDQFFADSLIGPFSYYSLKTDVGLAQHTSLREDLPGTVAALDQFLPFEPTLLESLAAQLAQAQPPCQLVVCDISPLGIAVAKKLGVPAVLVENFTWDWIYSGYPAHRAALQPHIDRLRGWFEAADYHIQAEPVCHPQQTADLTTNPISRSPRSQAAAVRRHLNIADRRKLVALTMGGIRWDYTFLHRLAQVDDVHFVIAGGNAPPQPLPNLTVLPTHSDLFHPDLINAADAVVGKVGYSTLAEIYWAGNPFGYISRTHFPETPALEAYIAQHIPAIKISAAEFEDGSWLATLPALLSLPRVRRTDVPNGAVQVAEFLSNLLSIWARPGSGVE